VWCKQGHFAVKQVPEEEVCPSASANKVHQTKLSTYSQEYLEEGSKSECGHKTESVDFVFIIEPWPVEVTWLITCEQIIFHVAPLHLTLNTPSITTQLDTVQQSAVQCLYWKRLGKC